MNTTGNFSLENPGSAFWESILESDLRYFPQPWSRPMWEDVDWSHHLLMSFSEGERLLGFALFSLVPDDETAHLLKILMLPEARGQGKTVLFWREVAFVLEARGAKFVYLEVETSNARALSFYRKIGFEDLRVIKGFYSDGTDALTMHLIL